MGKAAVTVVVLLFAWLLAVTNVFGLYRVASWVAFLGWVALIAGVVLAAGRILTAGRRDAVAIEERRHRRHA